MNRKRCWYGVILFTLCILGVLFFGCGSDDSGALCAKCDDAQVPDCDCQYCEQDGQCFFEVRGTTITCDSCNNCNEAIIQVRNLCAQG